MPSQDCSVVLILQGSLPSGPWKTRAREHVPLGSPGRACVTQYGVPVLIRCSGRGSQVTLCQLSKPQAPQGQT